MTITINVAYKMFIWKPYNDALWPTEVLKSLWWDKTTITSTGLKDVLETIIPLIMHYLS